MKRDDGLLPGWVITTWKLLGKHWAYCTGAFLCLTIVALMAGACGAEWYKATGSGVIFDMTNRRLGNGFSYTFSYYIFHMTFDQTFYIINTNTNTIETPQVYCDYTTSDCQGIIDGGFDTSQFQGMYAAILAFSLASIVTAIIQGILMLFLTFRADALPPLVNKIMTVVVISVSVILLAFLIITWGVTWRQPKATRMAVGLGDSFCNQYPIDDQYEGGTFCQWNGEYTWDDVTIRNLTFFRDVYATDVSQQWQPSDGFILTTISLGFSSWICLLTLGWRPAFFKS